VYLSLCLLLFECSSRILFLPEFINWTSPSRIGSLTGVIGLDLGWKFIDESRFYYCDVPRIFLLRPIEVFEKCLLSNIFLLGICLDASIINPYLLKLDSFLSLTVFMFLFSWLVMSFPEQKMNYIFLIPD